MGGSRVPSAPLPRQPISPATCLPGGGDADWEGREGDPCLPGSTARWCLRMQRVSQAPKASGGDLPTGPLQDWLPEPERVRDWVPRTQPIPLGGSPSILLIPRRLLE